MKQLLELKTHRFYKHRNCIDVFIGVNRIQYVGPGKIKLKIIWYVMGSLNWWPISNIQRFDLTKNQLNDWYEYIPDKNYKYE